MRLEWEGVWKEKRKTDTEMGGLREERFGGSGREWRTRARDGGVETAVKRDQ